MSAIVSAKVTPPIVIASASNVPSISASPEKSILDKYISPPMVTLQSDKDYKSI